MEDTPPRSDDASFQSDNTPLQSDDTPPRSEDTHNQSLDEDEDGDGDVEMSDEGVSLAQHYVQAAAEVDDEAFEIRYDWLGTSQFSIEDSIELQKTVCSLFPSPPTFYLILSFSQLTILCKLGRAQYSDSPTHRNHL